jgi:hypothetical protein
LDDFNDVFKVCEPIVFLDITSQTINLVHQSAKDYLVGQHLKLTKELSQYYVHLDKANLLLFQICWKYLSMEEFSQGNKIITRHKNQLYLVDLSKEYMQAYCFLQYASQE